MMRHLQRRGAVLARPHHRCGASALDPASLFLISIKDFLPVSAKQEGGMAADGRHTRMSVGSQRSGVVGRKEFVCNAVVYHRRMSHKNFFFGREHYMCMMLLPPVAHFPGGRQVHFGGSSHRLVMRDEMTPFHRLCCRQLKIAHHDCHLRAVFE